MQGEGILQDSLALAFLFLGERWAFDYICDDLIGLVQIFFLYKIEPLFDQLFLICIRFREHLLQALQNRR